MVSAPAQSHQIEHLGHPDRCRPGRVTAQEERQFHIFADCHCRQKVEELEDDAEGVPAVGGEGFFIGLMKRQAVHENLPGGRTVKPPQKVQKRALPAPARTGYRHKFSGGDIEGDRIQRPDDTGSGRIRSRDIPQMDHIALHHCRDVNPDQEDFEVLGETPDLLAVNKPAGLLVHPTKPDGPRTLWDGLRDLLRYELANGGQVSLINRLDRETSGIVLVAKSSRAARTAAMAMQDGKIKKKYLAIVDGWPEETFESRAPIIRLGEVGESAIHLQRTVHPTGAVAHTRFRVLSRIMRKEGRFALVSAEPLTGRTHQIRVHLAHCGFPVVGDKIYGPSPDCYLEFVRTKWTPALAERLLLPRHALHSAELELDWNGESLSWTSSLPEDLAEFHSAGVPADAHSGKRISIRQ